MGTSGRTLVVRALKSLQKVTMLIPNGPKAWPSLGAALAVAPGTIKREASDDGHDVDPPQGRKEINQRAAWQRKVLGKWVGIGKSKFFQGDYALMLPPSGSS